MKPPPARASVIFRLSTLLAMAVAPVSGRAAEATISPDGSLAISVNVSDPLTYQITVDGQTVVSTSRLGLEFEGGLKLGAKP